MFYMAVLLCYTKGKAGYPFAWESASAAWPFAPVSRENKRKGEDFYELWNEMS